MLEVVINKAKEQAKLAQSNMNMRGKMDRPSAGLEMTESKWRDFMNKVKHFGSNILCSDARICM